MLKKILKLKTNETPRPLSTKLLKWQNLTIIVADDVPKSILKYHKKYIIKVVVWKITDTLFDRERMKIIDQIYKRVDNLVKTLN